MPPRGEPAPGGSRVHCDSLAGVGARLCPSGLATATPQTFTVASRACTRKPAREFPPHSHASGRAAPGPYPPGFEPVHALKGVMTPVPLVLLSVSLAGPAPSGSTGTSRLCQGCSRPPRHHPDQAALSYSGLLRQAAGEGLSPPLEPQRLTAHSRRRAGATSPATARRWPPPAAPAAPRPANRPRPASPARHPRPAWPAPSPASSCSAPPRTAP